MKRAFTLIELMIVLFILSVLICTMKIHIQDKRFQATVKSIVEYYKIYHSAITMYYMRNGGKLPATLIDNNNTGRLYFECMTELKPYFPAGFTCVNIPAEEFKSIAYFHYNGTHNIVLEISINKKGDYLKLIEELKNQLCETLGDIPYQTSDHFVEFYIKCGDEIYL